MENRVIESVLLFGMCLGVVSCGLQKETTESNGVSINSGKKYESPIENLEIAFYEFELESTEGGTFELSNGTAIEVPENVLSTTEGILYHGKAKLLYREFHDEADLLLSGIPMAYNKDTQLQTAGMFEIKVLSENKEELEIVSGQKVNVRMASYVDDGCYNQFYLNDSTGKWELIGNDASAPNPKKVELLKQAKEIRTGRKFPLNKNYCVLNYAGALDVYQSNNWYFKDQDFVQKKVDGYGLKVTEYRGGGMIKFKGKLYPSSLLLWKKRSSEAIPKKNEKIHDYVWVENVKGNYYDWVFKDRRNREVKRIRVEVIMPLSKLLGKKATKWIDDYQAAVAKRKKIEAKANKMADLQRSFDVSDFGIYNCDRFFSQEGVIKVLAKYDFGSAQGFQKGVNVSYIAKSSRTVFNYHTSYGNMGLLPTSDAVIIAIGEGGTVMVCDQSFFESLNLEELRTNQNDPEVTFKFKVLDVPLNNENDFRKYLELEEKVAI